MKKTRKLSALISSIYENKEAYFDEIIKSKNIWQIVKKYSILLVELSFAYGLVMGSYNSILQALVAGIKVPALFVAVLLICFPSLYIIQLIFGSKLNIGQMLAIILLGFVLSAIIMVSFTPVIIFFYITGGNYHFIQLLHVAVCCFSGIFGLWLMLNALKYSCDVKGIYPKTGVAIFRIWIFILAFVSIQLSWNLRPFLGMKGEPFALFRHYEGNFYTAIVYSIDHLWSSDGSDYYTKTKIQSSKFPEIGSITNIR